eukprot:134775-Rhodomonas_salina.3
MESVWYQHRGGDGVDGHEVLVYSEWRRVLVYSERVGDSHRVDIVLRSRFAVSGTDIAYAPTRSALEQLTPSYTHPQQSQSTPPRNQIRFPFDLYHACGCLHLISPSWYLDGSAQYWQGAVVPTGAGTSYQNGTDSPCMVLPGPAYQSGVIINGSHFGTPEAPPSSSEMVLQPAAGTTETR